MKPVAIVAITLACVAVTAGVTYGVMQYDPNKPSKQALAAWQKARAEITRPMYDPEAARFSCVGLVHNVDNGPPYTFLGNVNAKNAFGAYTGVKSFSYSEDLGLLYFGRDIYSEHGCEEHKYFN